MYKKSLLNHTKLYLGPFNLNWAILTYVELADHPVVYWKISLTRGIIFQYTMVVCHLIGKYHHWGL